MNDTILLMDSTNIGKLLNYEVEYRNDFDQLDDMYGKIHDIFRGEDKTFKGKLLPEQSFFKNYHYILSYNQEEHNFDILLLDKFIKYNFKGFVEYFDIEHDFNFTLMNLIIRLVSDFIMIGIDQTENIKKISIEEAKAKEEKNKLDNLVNELATKHMTIVSEKIVKEVMDKLKIEEENKIKKEKDKKRSIIL